MLDNVLNSIDERINSKRNNFYGAGSANYGPYSNINYHGGQMQTGHSRGINHDNLMRGGPANGPDNFDKTRKISVLY